MRHPTQQLFGLLVLVGIMNMPIHITQAGETGQLGISAFPGLIAFNPPNRGAPSRRLGGGSRGNQNQLLMAALAPPQAGFTAQAQPTLYWFISQLVKAPVDLVVTLPNEENPVLETHLNSPRQPGIQAIDLAKLGIKLKPNVEYQWSVAVINDDDHRSADNFIAGTVVRTTANTNDLVHCQQHGQTSAAHYADQGLWYDALQCLNQLVAQNNTPEYRAQRESLLNQGDLAAVTKWLETHP